MRFLKLLGQYPTLSQRIWVDGGGSEKMKRLWLKRFLSTYAEEPELKGFMGYLDALTNYEKSGVPKGAGMDSDDGLDLGRMRRLMERLGNPQSKFKAIHIAGTKGKGSTASFLANILQAEGYNVGCYTSPHILTIRERMSVGKYSYPVSVKALNCLFHMIKDKLDEAIELENGCLTHFEVLTGIAFALFAKENVDVAVIEAGLGGARDATNILSCSGLAASVITTIGEEHLAALGGSLESIALAKAGIIKRGVPVVLGGPFLPHIETILREKAAFMHSPVLSASDIGITATIKGLGMFNDRPCQFCDITIQDEQDFLSSIELSDVKLQMLGSHQLQNATTAACAALCLRDQGWKISDGSIQAGLENTSLPGRSQLLLSSETAALGLPGAKILLDGAHTKDSANALLETVRRIFPDARLALVVAMATDKDHLSFAREFLSGTQLDAVLLTETDIAGGRTRMTPASSLRDSWIQACEELDINALHDGMTECEEFLKNDIVISSTKLEERLILVAEKSLKTSLKFANEILRRRRRGNQPSIIVVTGSLHIVSSVLASLHRSTI